MTNSPVYKVPLYLTSLASQEEHLKWNIYNLTVHNLMTYFDPNTVCLLKLGASSDCNSFTMSVTSQQKISTPLSGTPPHFLYVLWVLNPLCWVPVGHNIWHGYENNGGWRAVSLLKRWPERCIFRSERNRLLSYLIPSNKRKRGRTGARHLLQYQRYLY